MSEEAPPEYSNPNYEPPSSEPSVVIQTQNSIKTFSQKLAHHKLVKKYSTGFLVGFVLCLLVLLVTKVFSKSDSNFVISSKPTTYSCNKRVIGYYRGKDNQKISEHQIKKLTHIIFSGMKMQKDGKLEYRSGDTSKVLFLDMKNKTRTMKSGVKILFSTDSYNQEHAAPVMANAEARKLWINSISAFIIEQQIDGVELFYRWPLNSQDKENYVFFVRELRYKFEKLEKLSRREDPYIISIVTPPSMWLEESETILHELLDYADFLNVETNNYYGSWHGSGLTGPQAPLYSSSENKSVDWTMNTYICKTNSPSRLNFMIPFSGAHWIKVENHLNSANGVYRTADKDANDHVFATPWRDFRQNGWNLTMTSWHNESRTPYIWDSETLKLFTFENEKSVIEKMKYAMEKNIGGVLIEHIEEDDDSFTLLNAVTSINLCDGPKFEKDEVRYNCGGGGVFHPFDNSPLSSSAQSFNSIFAFSLIIWFFYMF